MGIETVVADKSQISDTKNKTLTSERFFIVLSFCMICAFAQDNSLPFHQYSDELDSRKYSLLEVESKFKNNWNNWLLHELRTSSTNSTLKYGVAKCLANEKVSKKPIERTCTRKGAKIVNGGKGVKTGVSMTIAALILLLYEVVGTEQQELFVIAISVLLIFGILIGLHYYYGGKKHHKEAFEEQRKER